jgi:hypothetical protein
MTFHLRSFTARRYRLEGELPSLHDGAFEKRLLDRAFQPLSPNEERSVGWVTADNCLDARFASGSVARGPAAVFALRVDKRRVNGRLLRAMMDLELRGRRKDAPAAAEGGGEGRKPSARRSREERTELRRQLSEELLRNTTPSMDVHSVLVYPKERFVLFGSLSKASNEAFRTLFADTFDVTLSALTPFHRALELLESRGASATLATLRRTELGRPYDEASAAVAVALGAMRPAIDPRIAAGRELADTSPEALS